MFFGVFGHELRYSWHLSEEWGRWRSPGGGRILRSGAWIDVSKKWEQDLVVLTRKKALAYQVYKKNTQPAQLLVPCPPVMISARKRVIITPTNL